MINIDVAECELIVYSLYMYASTFSAIRFYFCGLNFDNFFCMVLYSFCQDHSCCLGRKALLPTGQYQIILPRDTGRVVWVTCLWPVRLWHAPSILITALTVCLKVLASNVQALALRVRVEIFQCGRLSWGQITKKILRFIISSIISLS